MEGYGMRKKSKVKKIKRKDRPKQESVPKRKVISTK